MAPRAPPCKGTPHPLPRQTRVGEDARQLLAHGDGIRARHLRADLTLTGPTLYPLLDALVPGASAARLLHLAEIDVACKPLLLAVGQEVPWIDVAVWATGPRVSFSAWHSTQAYGQGGGSHWLVPA